LKKGKRGKGPTSSMYLCPKKRKGKGVPAKKKKNTDGTPLQQLGRKKGEGKRKTGDHALHDELAQKKKKKKRKSRKQKKTSSKIANTST